MWESSSLQGRIEESGKVSVARKYEGRERMARDEFSRRGWSD